MIGETIGHYRILAKLGEGGMGVVYEAEDLYLLRLVALKFLPIKLAGNPEMLERFRREARAASALNHPHICVVHELGEHEGQSYIVMERMKGQTLRQLSKGTPFPLSRVLELGFQLADALEAAHAVRIVHRDLKPANVFVTDRGEAKLMDFGLAKVDGADPGTSQDDLPTRMSEDLLTSPGIVMGTVAYMSPEQAKGEALDGRTDIFSLGVVLYELATGRLPFEGKSVAEFFNGILSHEPTPPSQLNPEISPELEAILLRALEKNRAMRYQHAREFKTDLKRLLRESQAIRIPSDASLAHTVSPSRARFGWPKVVAGGTLGLGLALGGWWAFKAESRVVKPKRIAVLSFENLGAAEDAYFTDGMTDEVRSKLTGLQGLSVIARGSADQYKGTTKAPEQIARELGVTYLLTAKIRWQKTDRTSRIRITPELVEVGKGAPTTLWQEAFEADLQDVFWVQSDIAAKVVQAMKLVLPGQASGRMGTSPTGNLAAYDAYLKGQAIQRGGQAVPILRRAAAQYEQAVALDPGFALAWARLATVHGFIYGNGIPSPQEGETCRKAAERALALAPTLPEAYGAMGTYHYTVTKDFHKALEAYAQGLRLAPDHAELLRASTFVQQVLGRWEEGLHHLRQAKELDPRNFAVDLALGEALFLVHRPQEAREALARGLALEPANLDLIEIQAMTFLSEGDLAGARKVISHALESVPAPVLVAFFSEYWDLDWTLDDAQRELLFHLKSEAFGDDPGALGLTLAQAASRKGDKAQVRLYAEEARKAFAVQSAAEPLDSQRHSLLGLSLAYLGQREEAIREGGRAVALLPIAKDAWFGPYKQHQLVRIHILLGNQERALDLLEPLLKTPYLLTPGWLRIDPNFAPLRGNPRFEKLAKGN